MAWHCHRHTHTTPWGGMMTSSNGNIFSTTGLLCREFTGHHKGQWCGDVFFYLRLNEQLSKQPWGWFEMPPRSLQLQCNMTLPQAHSHNTIRWGRDGRTSRNSEYCNIHKCFMSSAEWRWKIGNRNWCDYIPCKRRIRWYYDFTMKPSMPCCRNDVWAITKKYDTRWIVFKLGTHVIDYSLNWLIFQCKVQGHSISKINYFYDF